MLLLINGNGRVTVENNRKWVDLYRKNVLFTSYIHLIVKLYIRQTSGRLAKDVTELHHEMIIRLDYDYDKSGICE